MRVAPAADAVSSAISDRRSIPARTTYVPAAGRARLVLDVLAAPVPDLTVAAGPDRVRIAFDHATGEYDRTFAAPAGSAFTDEREAVYNNGVLTVSLGIE